MSDFTRTTRPRFADWPRWVCGEIDRNCGHVCALTATKMALWDKAGQLVRVYCDEHAPEGAQPIPVNVPFCNTRIEMRVIVASLPGMTANGTADALRLATSAIEAVGGAIVGVHVLGQRRAVREPIGEPLRLQLAGPAEGSARAADMPWGELDAPVWPSKRRRRA